MKVKRDIKIRNNYRSNELFLNFLRKMKKNEKIAQTEKIKLLILEKTFTRKYHLTHMKNYCNFSKKPRAAIRSLKGTGYSYKQISKKSLYLNGFKKSS